MAENSTAAAARTAGIGLRLAFAVIAAGQIEKGLKLAINGTSALVVSNAYTIFAWNIIGGASV